MSKKTLGINVLDAANSRLDDVFKMFTKIYCSFSGGKDSTVLLHLAAKKAREHDKKIGVLIVDLEGQYKLTVDHISAMLDVYSDVIEPYWVCLPIALRNAVSVYEPKWICWDKDAKGIWIRDLPRNCISNEGFFPFFRKGMEFEDFVPKFGEWYSQGEPTACLVGIRTDESLNRYRTIASSKKKTLNGRQWTTKLHNTMVYNCYPIYDWKTKDIWVYHAKFKEDVSNPVYDMMHKAGLSIHQQRLCQPYGDDQRKGLWLYHAIEPDTWAKVVARVSGANSGAEFVKFKGNASGYIKVTKPDSMSWEQYSKVLLDSMPPKSIEHYRAKITTFLNWWSERGYPNGIPDEEDLRLENSKKAPSWRRIAKMLLRNDYWAKGLSFTQTKDGYFYQKYIERKRKEYKEYQVKLRGRI